VHPQPNPLESLSSWLGRIATLYGLSVKDLLTHNLDLVSVTVPAMLDWDPPEAMLAALAERTGVEVGRLLRSLLDEVSLALSTLSKRGRTVLERIWRATGRPERGGLTVWRPYEQMDWAMQEAMLHAAATALHLAAGGQITARSRLASAVALRPHQPVYDGDDPAAARWPSPTSISASSASDSVPGSASDRRSGCGPQVAVHGFAADAEFLGQHGFPLTGGGALTQLAGTFGGEGGFAAGVGAALFGCGDALALAFQDQGAFEFGEGAHDRQQQGGHRGVLAGEGEVLLDELHPHSLAGQGAHGAA
jgi:hypothetical protein